MEDPEETNNRTFMIASIALGGIFVAGLVALGIYMFRIRPAQMAASAARSAEINLQNTQVAVDAQATADGMAAAAVVATPVPVQNVAAVPTVAPTAVVAPTATMAAVSAAVVAPTAAPAVSKTLPDTGFADDIGLPTLLMSVAGLLGVIVITRSIRRFAN
ncbi:MAG: hypothetical protein DWI63_04060 [Chloroflexi bacterium]|nr:hypothetical protein [Chloroflexota bacterium]RLT44043.1 MAG: hypothetical protein DWI62_04510 [Chloroflexota bacterium]RLT45702.1 MAG: hypothetical protein DWI63_04060 [Chloroflexota bacterium]